MLLVDDVLLFPVTSILWVFREVHEAAQQELGNEADAITARLSELYMRLETNEITEAEFDAQEKTLLDRLDRLRADEAGLEGDRETGEEQDEIEERSAHSNGEAWLNPTAPSKPAKRINIPADESVDYRRSEKELSPLLHPFGLHCPRCKAEVTAARHFRIARRTNLMVYRCKPCGCVYNLYTGTAFGGTHLRPQQAIALLRAISKGDSIADIAAEIGVCSRTAKSLDKKLRGMVTKQTAAFRKTKGAKA